MRRMMQRPKRYRDVGVTPKLPNEHMRRSSVNFRGHDIFFRKICMKNYQNARICTWFLPETLSKYPNFYDICPKNARILLLHNNCPKKYFPEFLGPHLGATENAGPGQCRTWKLTDQIAGLEIARPGKWRTTSQCGWKMQDLQKWRNKSQGWQCKTSDWVARRFTS